MLYGVTFGDYNTMTDWGLYTVRRAMLSSPEAKTHTVDIPGGDSSLDLTEALTGSTSYYDRELSFEFKKIADREDWDTIYSTILNAIHGRDLKIILDDDPNYYYEGRVQVGALEPINNHAFTIDVSATVNPFKWENELTTYSETITSSGITNTDIDITSLGTNVSSSSSSVDLRFGTAEIPTFDFSLYTRIYITYIAQYVEVTISFYSYVDGTVKIFNNVAIGHIKGNTYTNYYTTETLESYGLDPSTLYRIEVANGSDVSVKVRQNSFNVTVEGGTRNTIPEIYIDEDAMLALNGASYTLEEGNNRNADMQLAAGDNVLGFGGSFDSATVEISYRRGWL